MDFAESLINEAGLEAFKSSLVSKRKHRIVVLTSWSYGEGLMHSYVLPYLKIMLELYSVEAPIHLLTLEKKSFSHTKSQKEAIKKELLAKGISWKPQNYYRFGFLACLQMLLTLVRFVFLIKKEKVTSIHAICTPSGMLGYFLSRLTGIELVLDSLEPHSDMMLESGTWKKENLAYRWLAKYEVKQTKHALKWIVANQKMVAYAKEKYGVQPKQLWRKPACVNVDQFIVNEEKVNKLRKKLWVDSEDIVCVCNSKIGGMYLEQPIFDFFKVAKEYWGDQFKVLLLNNHPKQQINELCDKVGLNPNMIIQCLAPYAEVPNYLAMANFALSPLKPIPANQFTTPVKNGEYWAAGLPVVIPQNISEDSYIIEAENIGAVLSDLSEESYQKAIERINILLKEENKQQLSERIRLIANRYRNYEIAQHVYQEVYEV